MEQLIFDPNFLVARTRNIDGFGVIDSKMEDKLQMYEIARDVAQEWTDNHTEGCGFGSSDMTFVIKDYIDRLIFVIGGGYKTDFTPCLTVINN